MVLSRLSECLPEHEDVSAEVSLFDKSVGPDGLHQIVFGNYFITVADQDQKDLKGLRSQRNRLAGPQQSFFLRIHPKRAELVELLDPRCS